MVVDIGLESGLVERISVVVNDQEEYVKVMVTASKLEEWRMLLEKLDTKPLVRRKLVQQFTGKMSWAAGFIPQLKPFVRMLYAALTSNPSKLQGQGQVYHRSRRCAGSGGSYGVGDLKV